VEDHLSHTTEELRASRPVPDEDFDRVYPDRIRRLSARFWTPVATALRAAELLSAGRPVRILDIGSGVGKFCITGSLSTRATFTGLEQRRRLVTIARHAVEVLGAPRVRFVCGRLDSVSFRDYDAFYFFNPFEENLFADGEHIDRSVPLTTERFRADVTLVEERLNELPVGARVAMYHGFGGRMPPTYRLDTVERHGTGQLRLWVREATIEAAMVEPPWPL
jgi:hypothetical protein